LTFSVSSKLGKLVFLRTLPHKIPLVLKSVEGKTHSFERSAIRTIKNRLQHSSISTVEKSEFLETASIRDEIRSVNATESLDKVGTIPQAKNYLGTFSGISMSELKYPMKELTNIPSETLRVLDEFSLLPMWFTMPVVLTSSIVLGAIVALIL